MRPGDHQGPASTRARQCVSFFILALFLGLFVGAMTKPSAIAPQDHLILSFPSPPRYTSSVNAKKGQLALTFPEMSVMQLQQEYLEPTAISQAHLITDVRFETAPEVKGARIVISCAQPARVRLLDMPHTNQVMVNVAAPNTVFDTGHKAVVYSNASLYST